MAILIFIPFCEVAFLVSLEVIVGPSFGLSLLFISHSLKLSHFIIINDDEVFCIVTFLTLGIMVAAHRSVIKHSHVIFFLLRSLGLVGILFAVTTIHTVLF